MYAAMPFSGLDRTCLRGNNILSSTSNLLGFLMLIVAFLKEVVQEPFSLISMHRVFLRLSRKTCLWFMDMLTKRSCMSLFVQFHQLQKILWSRPWRVALRMSEPSWYVTSCCLTLRGRNCLSLVLESSYLRSALALFE